MTSIVQQNCQIIKQVNREILGTRLGYFGSEYKIAEQSFDSFHEDERRELLTKNQGSKLTHTNSQNAKDFDNLRVTKFPLTNVCELESSMSPKHFEKDTTCETNKTADER